jgi:hypothetical protein
MHLLLWFGYPPPGPVLFLEQRGCAIFRTAGCAIFRTGSGIRHLALFAPGFESPPTSRHYPYEIDPVAWITKALGCQRQPPCMPSSIVASPCWPLRREVHALFVEWGDVDFSEVDLHELNEDIVNLQEHLDEQRKRDNIMLDRANEWYLRAEVVKLTSHGISMTILDGLRGREDSRFEKDRSAPPAVVSHPHSPSFGPAPQEVHLLWPEHHPHLLHGDKPTINLFTFQSPHAKRLALLRREFYDRQERNSEQVNPLNKFKAAASTSIAVNRLSDASHEEPPRSHCTTP